MERASLRANERGRNPRECADPAAGCSSVGSVRHRDTERFPVQKEPTMANGIVNLSTSTFDEQVLGADKPVLVDFWAEWCGPCLRVAPVLEEIAGEQAEQLTIAKVNVDDNPELAQRYHVMSIPTMLVFSGGEISKKLVGAMGKTQLLRELDE